MSQNGSRVAESLCQAVNSVGGGVGGKWVEDSHFSRMDMSVDCPKMGGGLLSHQIRLSIQSGGWVEDSHFGLVDMSVDCLKMG